MATPSKIDSSKVVKLGKRSNQEPGSLQSMKKLQEELDSISL